MVDLLHDTSFQPQAIIHNRQAPAVARMIARSLLLTQIPTTGEKQPDNTRSKRRRAGKTYISPRTSTDGNRGDLYEDRLAATSPVASAKPSASRKHIDFARALQPPAPEDTAEAGVEVRRQPRKGACLLPQMWQK